LLALSYVQELLLALAPGVLIDLHELEQLCIVPELGVQRVDVAGVLLQEYPEAAEALADLVGEDLD
jgi:hypothetical protein